MDSNRIVYVARDIERALGKEPSGDYFVVANESDYARSIKEKYPDFVLLVSSPTALDTFEILEKEETAAFIKEKFAPADKPAILVFKNTVRIEEICAKNGWQLLNPPAALAEKIENKISQAEWLGDLGELLPSFKIAGAKEIKWEKKPIVLQFAHAHTGLGTILINNEKELKEIQAKFPDRPVKASEYIKGPMFTVNIVVKSQDNAPAQNASSAVANVFIGNPSYQITGMPPLTDSPFATVGNDWSLTHSLLSERALDELRGMAEKIGQKMQASGWKGLFGIDVIYDEERDRLELIEINARQPASTAYESQLQARFRGHGLVGSTIFEAHLAALCTRVALVQTEQIELNDSAQIVQRVTKNLIQGEPMDELTRVALGRIAKGSPWTWTEKIAFLNKAGYFTISYSNTKPNSDFLRIQSDKGLMEKDGKFNKRGLEIVEILDE